MSLRKQVGRFAKWISRPETASNPACVRTLQGPRISSRKRQRTPQLEQMEPRLLLAADPIQIGAVYVEEDLGSDLHGDLFYVTFQGGAPGTQLNQLTIDGDLGSDGFSLGDVFFDTEEAGVGADEAFAFQVEELRTAHPGATVSASVDDGSTELVLSFTNFAAGDTLIFSIDVDEVQFFDPNVGQLSELNDFLDPITSGVEFQSSILSASFSAPHYEDIDGQERFLNRYDDWLDQTGLPLPRDNHDGKRDRTAGAGVELVQQPKPVSLSGQVFVDTNEDLLRQSTESPLAGVALELFVLEAGNFVSTGRTTSTDASGSYSFGQRTELQPGIYQVRETQPSGFYSVGATPGSLDGAPVGEIVSGNPDVLTQIDLTLGDSHAVGLNFAENRPNSIGGSVCLVTSGFTCFDNSSSKEALAGVQVELLDSSGSVVQVTRTDSSGDYLFDNLRAGTYSVRESTPSGVIDGGARVGSQGGVLASSNLIAQIVVGGGVDAQNYDFCEIAPSEISGHTYYDANNNGRRETNETLLADISISLLDEAGNVLQETRTDANGFYRFDNLSPGTYRLLEITPAEYLPGRASVGTIGGTLVGRTDATGDRIDAIVLEADSVGVDYDFGEILAASIAGEVYVDNNGNCIRESGEIGLGGVRVELFDASGNRLQSTLTSADGSYRFENLLPGIYTIRETQPAGYFQGGQKAGTGGGDDSTQDVISAIDLSRGGDVVNYDFCEQEPGSISGTVFLDLDFDCFQDPGEEDLAGITVELLNNRGQVIAATETDADGNYRFDNLESGTYSVREQQPDGLFHGGQTIADGVGNASVDDIISAIALDPGEAISDANFCEVPAAEISGYVFQDGEVIVTENGEVPEDLRAVRDGSRTNDDTPIAGVTLELRTLTGALLESSNALPGAYGGEHITVQTDATGFFRFAGIRSGSYHVYQIQPQGFQDGIDTRGTTTGFPVNKHESELVPSNIIQLIQLSNPGADPGTDAILQVSVDPGQVSLENNFSEVLTESAPEPQDPPVPPLPPATPPPPTPQLPAPEILLAANPVHVQTFLPVYARAANLVVGNSALATWHLSVINGGFPRGLQEGEAISLELVAKEAKHLDVYAWALMDGRDTSRLVSLASNESRSLQVRVFDIPGAEPLAGDFDGDSFDELVLFADGEWFIDFNGNGRWDEADIWLKMGTHGDQPVVGDWDGDGKDDVGIFGASWKGDERALAAETGLPDPENNTRVKPKNVPPNIHEAPDDPRLMKRSASAHGRADLIDHVFRFGGGQDLAISGDFNGDSISTIGTFRDGLWILDVDGNGRLNRKQDEQRIFGQPGDLPLVGDFDGDGIDELAIVRGNRVIVDSNDNGHVDATDQVFVLDSTNGTVIVGDFDGDGRDEPMLHQSASTRQAAAEFKTLRY